MVFKLDAVYHYFGTLSIEARDINKLRQSTSFGRTGFVT